LNFGSHLFFAGAFISGNETVSGASVVTMICRYLPAQKAFRDNNIQPRLWRLNVIATISQR